MFVKERQDKIIEKLHKQGKILVKELALEFKVTEDCIRKDLAALEGQGQLKRSYGGAILERVNVHKEDVIQRKDVDLPVKKEIAQKALSLIKDGDMVFLDISTINIEVAKCIAQSHKKVTIISNMIEIMNVLIGYEEVTFIFAGGSWNRGRDGFIGSLTIDFLKHYHFDIAFMGVVGIDVNKNSISTYVADDGLTKQTILESSRTTYMVCEVEKFEREGNYRYAGLEAFDGIIIGGTPSLEIMNKLKEVQLHIV